MTNVEDQPGVLDEGDEGSDPGRAGPTRAFLGATKAKVSNARERHATVALPFRVLERESRVAASVLAGGFAYKLFLWLLPFGLLLGGVFGINSTTDIEGAIRGGGLVGAAINSIGDSTRATGFDPWLLLAIGVGGIFWAGRSGARAAQLIYALIWDEPPPRSKSVPASLAFTGVMCAFLVILGLNGWFRDNASLAVALLMFGISIAAITGLWVVVSGLLPHGDAAWQELLPGSLLVAIGVVVIHELIASFLFPKLQESTELYGVLGAMTTVLFYMYWVGAVFVSAATLNHSLHHERRSRRDEPSDDRGSAA